jgi:hypothetical protein
MPRVAGLTFQDNGLDTSQGAASGDVAPPLDFRSRNTTAEVHVRLSHRTSE